MKTVKLQARNPQIKRCYKAFFKILICILSEWRFQPVIAAGPSGFLFHKVKVRGWLSSDISAHPLLMCFSYKASWFHINGGAGHVYFPSLSHRESIRLALTEPQSLSVEHIDRQTSRRDLHEQWMALSFCSSCPGIVILGALSESTGSGKSLMHKLFLTATLLYRGKYIRPRMMLNIDPVLCLQSGLSL